MRKNYARPRRSGRDALLAGVAAISQASPFGSGGAVRGASAAANPWPTSRAALGDIATGTSRNDLRSLAAPRRAYVTLLYNDFLAGTRALGQSLRDSGTTADTMVLVTPDVPEGAREVLASDGWM